MLLAAPAFAQDLASVLDANRDQIERPSRQTIAPVIEALAAAGPQAGAVLEAWADRRLGLAGDRFVIVRGDEALDAVTGAPVPGEVRVLRPNSGVRGVIGAAELAAMKPGAILCDCSTVDVDSAREAFTTGLDVTAGIGVAVMLAAATLVALVWRTPAAGD